MYQYSVNLVRVIDGDSVVLDIDLGFGIWKRDVNCRLLDIDAPEIRTTDESEKERGFLAKDYLTRLLRKAADGDGMFIDSKEIDSFGRPLVNLYIWSIPPINVSSMMLEHGHAEKYKK